MLVDTMITSGRADHSGGGIYNKAGTVSLIRTTVAGNYVSDIGGGIVNEKGAMSISNSTISGNFAGKNGGGIYNFAGTITVTNTTLAFNNAGFNGAGILNNEEGTVALKNSIISNVPSNNTRVTGNCGGTFIDGNKISSFPTIAAAQRSPLPIRSWARWRITAVLP